ncbi:MAG TPA: hypothetical protein VLD62_06980, partial [Acidimicrobiia bacterium]|nr:hypothetical protein [Acidimicrobiia bacterium]
HPGVPLGIDPGLTSVQGVVLGWGSGVSAPWPLLLALLVVGVGRRGPQIAVPLLGLVFLAGALMEPISWDAAGGSHGIGLAVLVWLNVVVPAALIAVGIGSRRSPDVALGR